MQNSTKKKRIIITDSGFGGLTVLGEAYEIMKSDMFCFPVELCFVDALPKNCNGYPWKGYSLMPDEETKIKVFNNFLRGLKRDFNPDIIAVACNTLSVIAKKTEFYKNNSNKILDIVEVGLNELKESQLDEDSYLIILGTETTISSDIHRQWLIKNGYFSADRILPAAFPAKLNYPLLIETEPGSKKTYEVSQQILANAVEEINSGDSTIYIYLGCTHFSFVKDQYIDILRKLGFGKTQIIDPGPRMTEEIVNYVRGNDEGFVKDYILETKVYSQFSLTPEQISSGTKLINKISPTIAESLKDYSLKRDIIES